MPTRSKSTTRARASRTGSDGKTQKTADAKTNSYRERKPRSTRSAARTKKQTTVHGTEFRFVTAKLYGDDAEKADWVAEHANLTDLVTSSVRLCHATLQKFFNQTLPDYYSTPKVKLRHMDQTHQLMVDVQTDVFQQYIKADKTIEEKFGKSPGPEFLMSLAILRDDPFEIAEEYVEELIAHFSSLKPSKE
jgi:hypothetical protein